MGAGGRVVGLSLGFSVVGLGLGLGGVGVRFGSDVVGLVGVGSGVVRLGLEGVGVRFGSGVVGLGGVDVRFGSGVVGLVGVGVRSDVVGLVGDGVRFGSDVVGLGLVGVGVGSGVVGLVGVGVRFGSGVVGLGGVGVRFGGGVVGVGVGVRFGSDVVGHGLVGVGVRYGSGVVGHGLVGVGSRFGSGVVGLEGVGVRFGRRVLGVDVRLGRLGRLGRRVVGRCLLGGVGVGVGRGFRAVCVLHLRELVVLHLVGLGLIGAAQLERRDPIVAAIVILAVVEVGELVGFRGLVLAGLVAGLAGLDRHRVIIELRAQLGRQRLDQPSEGLERQRQQLFVALLERGLGVLAPRDQAGPQQIVNPGVEVGQPRLVDLGELGHALAQAIAAIPRRRELGPRPRLEPQSRERPRAQAHALAQRQRQAGMIDAQADAASGVELDVELGLLAAAAVAVNEHPQGERALIVVGLVELEQRATFFVELDQRDAADHGGWCAAVDQAPRGAAEGQPQLAAGDVDDPGLRAPLVATVGLERESAHDEVIVEGGGRQLGLGHPAEQRLDPILNDGDPGAAADEHDRVELVGILAGVLEQRLRERGGGLDQIVDQALEAAPLEGHEQVLGPARVGPHEGQADLVLLVVAQRSLGLLRHVAHPGADRGVARQVDLVGVFELAEQPVDDALVDVVTAEVRAAAGREDLDVAVVESRERGVEAAGAEVQQQHGLLAGFVGFAAAVVCVVGLVCVAGLVCVGLARVGVVFVVALVAFVVSFFVSFVRVVVVASSDERRPGATHERGLEPANAQCGCALALEGRPGQGRRGGPVNQLDLLEPGDAERVNERASARVAAAGGDRHDRALDHEVMSALNLLDDRLGQGPKHPRHRPRLAGQAKVHVATGAALDRDLPPAIVVQLRELMAATREPQRPKHLGPGLGDRQPAGDVTKHELVFGLVHAAGVEAHDRRDSPTLGGEREHLRPTIDDQRGAHRGAAEVEHEDRVGSGVRGLAGAHERRRSLSAATDRCQAGAGGVTRRSDSFRGSRLRDLEI
ncbi:hypothetical protein DB30_06196 [Enhygromyxa salina]|uniref:Uncharacterized protein n=1 Tax=Enhygromyxa salina TaxID=215803 RepID=A0A0C1ZB53_9BACT|nr:hypothetical protein DB30_06196 [Enhygromyxa salina]